MRDKSWPDPINIPHLLHCPHCIAGSDADEVKGPYPTYVNSTAVPGKPRTVPVMTAYFGSRCDKKYTLCTA